LGRFFTQDAYAEKYFDFSPYQYAANNPINFIDVNGDSIWYTKQDNVITLHFSGKIINSSSDNVDMEEAANDIAKALEKDFTGSFKADGEKYELKTDVQLEVAESMEDVETSDHLFVIADAKNETAKGVTSMTRTTSHEFGHSAGLGHEDITFRLMQSGGNGRKVTQAERLQMVNSRHLVNMGPNSYWNPALRKYQPYPFGHDFINGERVIYHINSKGLYTR